MPFDPEHRTDADAQEAIDKLDADRELERLAQFVTEHFPGEPSQPGGLVDTVIRLLTDRLPENPGPWLGESAVNDSDLDEDA